MSKYIASFESYLLTQKRVARNTVNSYMLDITQYAEFLQRKKIELINANQDTLSDFFYFLRKQKQLSARSMARKISSLKVFYKYMAEKFGFIDISVGLNFPKLQKRLPNFLTEEEIYTVLKTASLDSSNNGIRNNILLHLLYITGIRVTEAVGLKISNIKFEENIVLVEGKGNKERLIPMPEEFCLQLKDFIKVYHPKILVNRQTDFLFPIKHAGRIKNLTRQAAWGILKKIVEKSGIKKRVTPHTLRHSLATHLLEKGANLRSLQVWLGHENLSTVEIYTHVNTDHLRKVYDNKHPRS